MSSGLASMSVALVLAGCLLFSGGCQSQPAGPQFESGSAVSRAALAPQYAQIQTRYNQRVAKLQSFWARADLRLEYLNEDGTPQKDEAEATLQYELPRNFSFMISKLGDHYFTLGSDVDQYWWIDRKVDPPTVVFGRHDLATRQKVAHLNVPMLPLEIVDCLGVIPLPALRRPPAVSWSPLRKWCIFRLPSNANSTSIVEYWVDPLTLDPGRIRILDISGKETIDCWHEVPALVTVGPRPDEATRMASKLKVFLPDRQTRLTITLTAMEYRVLKGSKAFDLPALRSAYRITREIDLDRSVSNRGASISSPTADPAAKPQADVPPEKK